MPPFRPARLFIRTLFASLVVGATLGTGAAEARPRSHPLEIARATYLRSLARTRSSLHDALRTLQARGFSTGTAPQDLELSHTFDGGACQTRASDPDERDCVWEYTLSADYSKTVGDTQVYASLQARIRADFRGNARIVEVTIRGAD